MKILRFLFCAAMIMSAAVGTCYSASDNNEEEGKIRTVIETYFEGIKTKDIKLVMSVISPSFLQVTDVEEKAGAKVDYDRKKKGYADFFENNNVLNLSFEITKIEITDNKATVETKGSMAGYSLKDSQGFSGNDRTSLFFLEKENQEWLIIGMQDQNE